MLMTQALLSILVSTLIHNVTIIQLRKLLQEGESRTWQFGHGGETESFAREGWGSRSTPRFYPPDKWLSKCTLDVLGAIPCFERQC